MSLDHAILGFLQYKPLSGYDLKAVFDVSVKHFWLADQSQIYRTLSRLAECGWAEIERVEQDDRPDRKVYHITKSGSDELIRWLMTPLPKKSERIPELIQIFFAGNLSDEEILAMFERLESHCRHSLEELQQIQEMKGGNVESAPRRDAFFWMLTLEYGIRMTEASLAWLEEVITRIKNGRHRVGE